MDKASNVEAKNIHGPRVVPTNYLRLSHNGKPALILTEDGCIVEEYSDDESTLSENSSIREKSVRSSERFRSIENKLKETDVKYSDMKAEMGKLKKRMAELELKSKTDDKKEAGVQTVGSCNDVNNTKSKSKMVPIEFLSLNFISEVPSYVYDLLIRNIKVPRKDIVRALTHEIVKLEGDKGIKHRSKKRNEIIEYYEDIYEEIWDEVSFDSSYEGRVCKKHDLDGPYAFYCELPDVCPYVDFVIPCHIGRIDTRCGSGSSCTLPNKN